MSDLKPCPHCGTETRTVRGPTSGRWWVDCKTKTCGDPTANTFATEADAIAAWNRRVSP